MKLLAVILLLSGLGSAIAQGPKVVTPTANKPAGTLVDPYKAINYPWHKNITATIFWIGEKPTPRNPTPNKASSWDTNWQQNYGGYDNPDPKQRINYRPKNFIPQLNPFYIALPYNDCINHQLHKTEAPKVVHWWRRILPKPGQTTCKGRWVMIYYKGNICYAQWEDCGPFFTDDWKYVFGNKRPKNTQNNGAGIDLSPAVRDYLKLKSGDKVHWKFIDFRKVPRYGPWTLYGKNNPFKDRKQDPDYIANQKYIKYLNKLRDEHRKHNR